MTVMDRLLSDRQMQVQVGGTAIAVALAFVLAPVGVVAIGLITGLIYALLAIGLVLIYKASRFINFAHGQIGAFSALLLAKAVIDWHVPYVIAFVGAVGLAVAIGAAVSYGLVRPLFTKPRLVLMVATIGVAQLLLAVSILWKGLRPNPITLVQHGYPTPIHWTVRIGHQLVRGPQFMILLVVPVLAIAGGLFFRYSSLGLRIRAVASNPDAARLASVSTRAVSTITWLVAGGVSGVTAILMAPAAGTYSQEVLGPGLLIRALAAGVVGRMTSLPAAFAAGLGLGLIENVVFFRFHSGGVTELVIFAVLIAGLLLRARVLSAASRTADEVLRFRTRPRPLPAGAGPQARFIPAVGLAVCLVAALLLPLRLGQADAFQLTLVVVFAIVGMSLTVVVGWSGQLSLGHFAFIGVGAYTAAKLAPHNSSLVLALIVAGVVGALIAVALGLPSLRVRGLFLGVSTLAFAVVAKEWAFNIKSVAGSAQVGGPTIAGIGRVTTEKGFYYVALVLFVVVAAGLRAVRRSGSGRLFVAVRDNERNASAHGIGPSGVKLAAFGLSGAIASAAGVVWAYATHSFDANAFPPQTSIALVAMLVIGGIGSLTGAVLGAIAVFGIPVLFHLGFAYALFISGIGVIATLLTLPDGLIARLWDVRDWVARQLERGLAASRLAAEAGGDAGGVPLLSCVDVNVRFGGLKALDEVTFDVAEGTIVGLIGTNGAGKTTLMDCISGHLRPSSGRISVAGTDVTQLAPEYRPFVGVGRSFQDASLYGGLTARETVQVALERHLRSGLAGAFTGAPWQRWTEREKARRADELLAELGLSDAADVDVAELSTGTRRVCDLATAIAQGPRLLLLDEPTAGLAQAEVEQFVPLLRSIRERLDCTILLIEHDMGLVMALASRIVVLEAGRVIADGTPEEIRNDPRVVASYLGSSDVAIGRSRHAGRVRVRDGEGSGSGSGNGRSTTNGGRRRPARTR
jgi:ABC-type branched-subunit amino acid transport system ATPase component/ABC-type branched-subunit amino acid transport system permease subunit